MTANGIAARGRRLGHLSGLGAGLALAIAAAGGGVAQEAPPSEQTACAVDRCLAVTLDPALAGSLASGTTTIEELAEGLSISYQGETPLAARLVVARYDKGRLVRYGVSDRVELDKTGDRLEIPDAMKAVHAAFRPATSRSVSVSALQHERLQQEEAISPAAFVGEVPSTYLAGADVRAVVAADVAVDDLPDVFAGSIGVIAVLPDDDALRAPETLATRGALVGLSYSQSAAVAGPTG